MNKMNVWRGISARLLSWLLLLTVVVAVSCSDDDDASGADVTVDFQMTGQTVRETDEVALISMKLGGAARRDGKLTFVVESGATYGIDYRTSPAVNGGKFVIPVVKGQTAVKFAFYPVYNSNMAGDRTVKFTLAETDGGFTVGEKSSTTITVVDVNTTATLTLSATSLSFGDVANGSTSTAKSFTVSGANLSTDVTVTAPTYYTVSTSESGTYASTATISAAVANAGSASVYVKFVPTSGGNQTLTNTITVTSAGVAAQTLSVTGNETGNVVSALLLADSFDYGASDNADLLAVTTNWTRHSGTLGPQYFATSLTYTGYPNSGGAIGFSSGSSANGDINRVFTPVTADNNIYVSFLVNISAANATQDYFFHVGPSPLNNTFKARLFGKAAGAGWSVALSKSTDAGVSDATVLNFNQTYLFVLKYAYSTASTSDDQVTLYIYDSGIPATESSTSLVKVGATGDAVTGDTAIGAVAVRQGTNTPTGKIDGIRVALAWADLFN